MHADGPDGDGLWIGDTRYLSEYGLLVDGRPPLATAVRAEAGSVLLDSVAAGLDIQRERYVDSGLRERITITNPGPSVAEAEIELTLGSDFIDMMALRGFAPELATPSNASGRAIEVVIQPPGARHHLELQPGGRFILVVDVHPRGSQEAEEKGFDVGLARKRDAYRQWAADCATFETDNPAVNELLRQSRDDLRMLLDNYPTGIYPTGGIPWYAVPFGRDALFTSLFTLGMNPEIARGSLRFLAAHQGRRQDPRNEEEPLSLIHI